MFKNEFLFLCLANVKFVYGCFISIPIRSNIYIFVVKGENKYLINERLSFGYGSEYKYDWGNFENKGSYTASTRGHVENLGLFGNFGLKIKEDTIFSTYYRSDNHKLTGLNETYKVNLLKNYICT